MVRMGIAPGEDEFMTLLVQARAELQAATAPFRLEVADAQQRLVCEFSALDTLACAFTDFTVSTDALAAALSSAPVPVYMEGKDAGLLDEYGRLRAQRPKNWKMMGK